MAIASPNSVLIIDDSPEDREVYRRLLKCQNGNVYKVVEADSAEAGYHMYCSSQPDCVLLDYNLPEENGVDILQQIAAGQQRPSAVVVLTGQGNLDLGERAMKLGALDYLVKAQVTGEALNRAIQRAIEKAGFLRKIEEQRTELEQLAGSVTYHKSHASSHLLGLRHLGVPGPNGAEPAPLTEPPARPRRSSKSVPPNGSVNVQSLGMKEELFYVPTEGMAQLMQQVERVAPQDTTILLTGETGTGKTRLARQIHELSPRRNEPFMVVNCGALSANLIESEMFGHVRGAFTGADRDRVGKFAAVGRGTLLLDEIDALPIELQAKLLRSVDERLFEPVGSNRVLPMEARLIAVSNRMITDEVAAGRFRADLHFRLNVVEFQLSPLRERRELIPFLVGHFFRDFVSRNSRNVCGIADEAMAALQQYSWPGNIRELRNIIERAVALCPGQEIQLKDLPEALRQTTAPASTMIGCDSLPVATMSEVCEEAEIARIRQALQRHNNNRQRAASELGISRMTLYKRLHRYGLFSRRDKTLAGVCAQ